MTPLRQRMIETMQLRGLAPRTQESYLAAVRQLAVHYGRSPDQLSDEELRQYFLYLRNDKRVVLNVKYFCRQRSSNLPVSASRFRW